VSTDQQSDTLFIQPFQNMNDNPVETIWFPYIEDDFDLEKEEVKPKTELLFNQSSRLSNIRWNCVFLL
jgi:hypothetical protein